MISTILIFTLMIILIITLYRVNKNIEVFIDYIKKNVNVEQNDDYNDEYSEKENDTIIDEVIKEMLTKETVSEKGYTDPDEYIIQSYKDHIKNSKSKSTCDGCRFLERHDASNGFGEVIHDWYCTEYKKYIVKDHGVLASTVKPICRDNKELRRTSRELVEQFDRIYNKHINN